MLVLMAALIMSITAVIGSNAQDEGAAARQIFYLSADESGVQQVFTQLFGVEAEPARQVTASRRIR